MQVLPKKDTNTITVIKSNRHTHGNIPHIVLPPIESDDNASVSDINQSLQNQDSMVLPCMEICEACKTRLLESYEHCLAHSEKANLESIRMIDEEADGIPKTEQPYFDIVQDPTRTQVIDEKREDIERDRWVTQEAKRSIVRLENAVPGNKKGKKGSFTFSGALYKRMLDAKEREITQLRKKLFDSMRKHQFEVTNVTRLKMALNRSVNYYTFAEEWQQNESLRLQQDIKYLKQEASSLMAHLINAEEEKMQLNSKINELVQQVIEKDKKVEQYLQTNDELKIKLQDAFKEYLWMDQNMAVLRREAQKGTQAADARNTMLQKTLEKLTFDFENCTTDLRSSKAKTRELEFELETLIRQFNALGESKKALDLSYANITSLLAATEEKLQALTKEHEQTLLSKSKVEANLRLANLEHESVVKAKDETIASLNEQNQGLINKKNELEGLVKSTKAKMDTQTANMKVIVNQKNQLQADMTAAAQKAEREIESRNRMINDLNEQRANDMKQSKKLQEAKEQLMFQITDLKMNLERETVSSTQLKIEIAQNRRTADEKINLLEDQLDKLTTAKTNLTKDKTLLTDKLKATRNDLKQKEDKLLHTEQGWDKYREEATSRIAELEGNLQQLQTAHEKLNQDNTQLQNAHKKLNEQYQTECEINQAHEEEEKSLKRKISDLKADLARSLSENEQLANSMQNLKDLHDSVTHQLSMKSEAFDSLNATHENLKLVSQDKISKLETENSSLRGSLEKLNRENETHLTSINLLKTRVKELESELSTSRMMHSKETALRELLESELHENRIKYENERKLRTEFERLSMKFKQSQNAAIMDKLSKNTINHVKLSNASKLMNNESSRLNDFVGMIPSEKDLGNVDLLRSKAFDWLFGPNAFSSGPPKIKEGDEHAKHINQSDKRMNPLSFYKKTS